MSPRMLVPSSTYLKSTPFFLSWASIVSGRSLFGPELVNSWLAV